MIKRQQIKHDAEPMRFYFNAPRTNNNSIFQIMLAGVVANPVIIGAHNSRAQAVILDEYQDQGEIKMIRAAGENAG